MMERVNRILKHEVFQDNLEKIKKAEQKRIFCCHDMVHFLDVARIGMILNLQENLQIPEDLLYAAALLHDIGKHEQYSAGTPHEKASARIAPGILKDCGYTTEEIKMITDAILLHRTMDIAKEPDLNGILYRADKASRACFACAEEKNCNWKNDRKNLKLWI